MQKFHYFSYKADHRLHRHLFYTEKMFFPVLWDKIESFLPKVKSALLQERFII